MRRVLAIVLLAACAEPSTPPAAPSQDPATPARLPPWRGYRALPRLPDAAGTPDAYRAARTAWQTATTAYARGHATAAAESYLGAAAALSGGEPEPIARTFASGRCLAYESAGRAYAAARLFDSAEERLTAASRTDPACQSSIAGALNRLREDRTVLGFPPLWRRL